MRLSRIPAAHIAKGGLGDVNVALDTELNREVALKEIQGRHANNLDSRARFLLEAEITGSLEHPCIVPVYGLGAYADGRPFYAMRFIHGDSLQDAIKHYHGEPSPVRGRVEGERTLELRQLLGRFVDVCQAIQYAHDRGVLHRDLKPGNIMLGKYGETLVVDWGLAKAVGRAEPRERPDAYDEPTLRPAAASGSAETLAGTTLGTPAYMSPEQAAGRLDLLGPASDVYSLGATLYCLLTGRAPVEGKDTAAVLQKVQNGDFPRPRQLKPAVNPALEAISLRAMALNRTDRYATPRALADDIEHWLADEPVSAYAEPWAGRARRLLKRHRASVQVAVAVLAVAAVSLAVATVLLSAKNEELTRANAREQAAKLQEQAAREQAQKNFQMAFQAVEDYLTGVAENDRLREKDLEPLRRDLFRSAQTWCFQRFAEKIAIPRSTTAVARKPTLPSAKSTADSASGSRQKPTTPRQPAHAVG